MNSAIAVNDPDGNSNGILGLPPRTEIAFVLDNVADWQTLAAGVRAGVQVVVLDSTGDGLAQMAHYLAQKTPGSVDAIHLLGHGSSGSLNLGALTLNTGNLQQHAAALAQISTALTADADWLLYGCNVAKGDNGKTFINALANITQADVAASDNLTGASQKNGDWILENRTGDIEVKTLPVANWQNTLAITQISFSSIFNADVVIGNSTDADTSLTSFDTAGTVESTALISSATAVANSRPSSYGLPDDGVFLANQYHPQIQLAAFNAPGNNAYKAVGTPTINIDVIDGQYDEFHIYAASGNGASRFSLVFHYADNTSTTSPEFYVADWFNEITETSSNYYLINGMDRINIGATGAGRTYQQAADPAIFGFKAVIDSTKTLSGFDIVVAFNTGTFNFFGAVTNPNAVPTLTAISSLTGTEDTPYTMTYGALLAASDYADADSANAKSFRIETVSSGTLTKGGVAVVAGVTLLGVSESLVWTPASNANGSALNAFTVKAWDGTATSTTATQVQASVTAVNDVPTFSGIPGTAQAVAVGTAAALADVTVADADGADITLSMTLTTSNGTVNGLTDADTHAEGIQLTGTAATLNTALAAATFTATAAGAASIGISASDGVVAQPVTATYNLTADPANRAPTLTQPPTLAFAAKADYATGNMPKSVSSADVNGDGKADLLVANVGSGTVSVLLKTTPPGLAPLQSPVPMSMATAKPTCWWLTAIAEPSRYC